MNLTESPDYEYFTAKDEKTGKEIQIIKCNEEDIKGIYFCETGVKRNEID